MNHRTVLIVEDDESLREILSKTLQLDNYQVETAENGEQALEILKNNNEIALLLSDVEMSPVDGHELLKKCKSKYPDLPFVLMTAYGTIENAVKTMHDGASDYLTKPFESDVLIEMVTRYVPLTDRLDDMLIAVDEKSVQLSEVAKRVALTEASVMISGESGVGKEVVSQFIHKNSNRSAGPFMAINCAAIPENMLESELFGYEKGAFTGAFQAKSGKFEQAQGGTLLLDEITEMDLSLQAKLLRVLQEREVERLGGRKTISLDVRILATTNRNIYKAVSEGRFREDLFYRLNVFPLHISPLRDRVGDILPLANKMLKHYSQIGTIRFSETSKRLLNKYSWPGNVRELDNVVQRALILKSGNIIEDEDIHLEDTVQRLNTAGDHSGKTEELETDLSGDLKAREQDLIISALNEKTSRKEVAERLGISARTLRYKLAKMRDAGVVIPA